MEGAPGAEGDCESNARPPWGGDRESGIRPASTDAALFDEGAAEAVLAVQERPASRRPIRGGDMEASEVELRAPLAAEQADRGAAPVRSGAPLLIQ